MSDLSSAIRYFRSGQPGPALQCCRQILAQEPADAGALNLQAVCLFQLGRAGEAIPLASRALRLQPELAEAAVNLAVILQTQGRSREAETGFRHVLACNPTHPVAIGRLAGLAQERGDLEGALVRMQWGLRLAPDAVQDRLNLALVRQAAGYSAVSVVRPAAMLSPNNVETYARLGAILLGEGRTREATVAFLRARAIDPTHRETVQGLERCARYLQAIRAAQSPAPAVPVGFVARGALTPMSGYGHMTCRFLEHLQRQGVPVHAVGLFGSESWPGLDSPVQARAALSFLIPTALEPLPGLRTVLMSMFEGTLIPPAWARASARCDLVIVPCEASKRAWVGQGYPEERIRLCPLGVDPAGAGIPPELTDLRGRAVGSYRTRILNVSDFIPRKNVDGLLRVWLNGTHADDDAVLILKLGKGSSGSRQAIEALIARTEQAVGRRMDRAAAVAIVDRRLAEEEMNGLYLLATHYWSLSHGEGWDLPLTKAGAHGLGLIAPRNSAYEDYLDDSVARLIPCRTGPALQAYSAEPYPPFFGLDWWNPDEEAAAEVIAAIVQGRDRLPDPSHHLLRSFSWERATARLATIMAEAGA